jgi:hypothetical protein
MTQGYQITASKQEVTITLIENTDVEHITVHPIAQKTVTTSTKTKKRGSSYTFPKANDSDELKMICSYDRVIKIYNRYNKASQKKLTNKVEQWFLGEAKRHDWSDVEFIQHDDSTKKSCVLIKTISMEKIHASVH